MRKKTKLNFINFFEKNEHELLNQKKYSLFLGNYGLNRNLTWFTDFHDYTFFNKFFVLKRDRFWYSVARRETLKKYHQGRNMLTDSWEQNYEIQQKSLYFLKENDNSFFFFRNSLINSPSIRFLEFIKQTALKKHFVFIFFSFFVKIMFFFNLLLFFIFFNDYNLLLLLIFSNTIYLTFYPLICFFFLKNLRRKFKFIKLCILLNLRKPFIYKSNKQILFLKSIIFFFNYFINFLFYNNKFIFKNYYILSFLGKLYDVQYCKFSYIGKNFNFLKNILIIIIFLFINIVFFCYFVKHEIYFYQMYYFLDIQYLKFVIIFISFFFFSYFKFILNFFLPQFKRKNEFSKYFCYTVLKIYFQGNAKKGLEFIDICLINQNCNNNLNFNQLFEQFNILQSIKNLQYIEIYKKLKKNAF